MALKLHVVLVLQMYLLGAGLGRQTSELGHARLAEVEFERMHSLEVLTRLKPAPDA